MSRTLSISFEPKNLEDLKRFFETNKNKYDELWVILTKKAHVNPQPVSFNEAIAEAISQGLVDSRTKTLTTEKYATRFTERKSDRV